MTYEERIDAIASYCDLYNVPYTTNSIWNGKQIRFPWCAGDVACHEFTYGTDMDKVESYCFPWDNEDVTVLSIEEAAGLIVGYYYGLEEEEEEKEDEEENGFKPSAEQIITLVEAIAMTVSAVASYAHEEEDEDAIVDYVGNSASELFDKINRCFNIIK